MSSLLEVYRDYARKPGRRLSTADLRRDGFSPAHARVTLHRLRSAGMAQPAGPGAVRLLLPDQARPPPAPTAPPWERRLLATPAKATGFAVLPQRDPAARPKEFVVPSSKAAQAARQLRQAHTDLRVYVDEYHAEDAVCLYPGPVRGRRATTEDALVHVYRHAPRADFALALQAVLMEKKQLNWGWLRRQPEWDELAGVFVAVNELAGHRVFPAFRAAEPPDLTYAELQTVAQPFTARGPSM
jgi:hypothetical protein